jgi:hypothetical protein
MSEKLINKKVEEILNKLNSGRDDIILETISFLRENGNLEILPELFKLLAENPSEVLEIQISSFLNDLKSENASQIIVQSIQNNKKGSHLDKMISSCWQNGLDFSKHLKFFVDIAIEEDFLTAIEAFSVVEENINNLELSEREELASYLKSKIKVADEAKMKLLSEMEKLISSFSGPLRLDLLN